MWLMPEWMEPYRSLIESGSEKASAEVCMQLCERVELLLELPHGEQLIPLVVRARIFLLEDLHKKGLLLPIGKEVR